MPRAPPGAGDKPAGKTQDKAPPPSRGSRGEDRQVSDRVVRVRKGASGGV